MENQKSTINNNPSNSNNASSSGTSGAISEQEKEIKKAECKAKYREIFKQILSGEITHEEYRNLAKKIASDYHSFLSLDDYDEIISLVEKETGFEADSEESDGELKEGFYYSSYYDFDNLSRRVEEEEKPLAVYTKGDGQAVLKKEISQELTAIKTSFENIKISEVSGAEIKSKVRKTVERLIEKKNFYPSGFISFGSVKQEPIQEAIEERVKRLVKNATTDLEKQKNKAVKKMNALIKAREEEVVQAQKLILDQNTLIEEGKQKYQALAEKSEREIKKLQKSIEELNNRLKKYERTKEELRTFTERKASGEKITPKAVMKNEEEKIKELEKEIEEMRLALKIANAGWDSEKLELEQTKAKLDRETTILTADLTAKQDELERERKIFLDKQKQLNEEIRQVKRERDQIRADWNEEDSEIEELRAKNQILKREKADLENKKSELEETIKGLQPSYAYQLAERFGIIKLKNLAVNACVAIVLIGGIYVISLVLKYLVKPTYKNVKSVFGSNKKIPLIAEEVDDNEEPEEENVFEVEPKKPQRGRKSKSITK